MSHPACLVRQPDQGTSGAGHDDRIGAVVRPLVRQPDQATTDRAWNGGVHVFLRSLVRQPDRDPVG
jgi:hypothetical protein